MTSSQHKKASDKKDKSLDELRKLKSTRKEQLFSDKQIKALKSRDSNQHKTLNLSKDQSIYIIQRGWEFINKEDSKNVKFPWNWSGMKQRVAQEAVLANLEELSPVIDQLKTGDNKRGVESTPLPTSTVASTDLSHACFSSHEIKDKATVAMLINHNNMLLHFGNGIVNMRLPVDTFRFKNLDDTFVVMEIVSMEPPFAPLFCDIPYAQGEEVSAGGFLPWSKTKLVDVEEVVQQKAIMARPQPLTLATVGDENLVLEMMSSPQSTSEIPSEESSSSNNAMNENEVNDLKKSLEQEVNERKRQQMRAKKYEEFYKTFCSKALAFVETIQEMLESADIEDKGKSREEKKRSRALDNVEFNGKEYTVTKQQSRVLQSKYHRKAIRELLLVIQNDTNVNVDRVKYYFPKARVVVDDNHKKLSAKMISNLIQTIRNNVYMLKRKKTRAIRSHLKNTLEWCRQIVDGKYNKGQFKNNERKRKADDVDKRNKRRKLSDGDDNESGDSSDEGSNDDKCDFDDSDDDVGDADSESESDDVFDD